MPTLRQRSFWEEMPTSSWWVFNIAVFATFAPIGFVVDIFQFGRTPAWALALNVLLSGLFAIAYANTGIFGRNRQKYLFPLIGILHVITQTLIARSYTVRSLRGEIPPDFLREIRWRLTYDGFGILLGIAIGYTLFIIFFNREGEKYFRYRTELDLAAEIHQHLVPRFHEQVNGYEFYGESRASGEVGGDLVDLVQSPDGSVSIAYIADVSGHGVAPGLVMGMIKSAARMKLTEAAEQTSTLLPRLNSVLYPLKKPNMFATFGYVAPANGHVEYGLAGHHAILYYSAQTRSVNELSVANLPLGILESAPFETTRVQVSSGDVLLLVTDGYLELEDKSGTEFGMDRLKELLAKFGAQPPDQIAAAIKAAAQQHGVQTDDQSILLVRKA